ncbi:MAG TPA: DUF4386 domain-containing protein [Candidatus Sulfotelmatobacter sp.]|nr:DUF4386 domain-containing protein [Candidatus Sulfotelmatobacter sp.]
MSDEPLPPAPVLDRAPAFGLFSLLSGAASVLVLIARLQPTPRSAAGQLAYFAGHQGLVALEAVVLLVWAVFSVPLVVALGQILRPKSPAFALSATLLSAVGVLLLGFAMFAHVGALLSIIAAGGPPNAADAIYQAAVWGALSLYLTEPGLMSWGLGQLLFGWLAWRSHVLPNWVSIVGSIGGIAGLLTLAVYQAGMLALVQLASFAVWGFATSIHLLRRRQA